MTTTTTGLSPPQSQDDNNKQRTQSIQELRELEKKRREEIAGKIDMSEQHALMSQFEQQFTFSKFN